MNQPYNFDLVNTDGEPLADHSVLFNRPFVTQSLTMRDDSPNFEPGEELLTAMNTAVALGEPLLLTGEPGTGKTQAAYFLAWRLGLEIEHFQVKSESTARDLLYHFDSVRYFHDAGTKHGKGKTLPDKETYVDFRGLGKAIDGANHDGKPRVVLLDEIDKAPRDFPNDLLLELDQMEFTISETGRTIRAEPKYRPVVVITSNSERRLPEPFLRRCVYHNIDFNDSLVRRVVAKRRSLYAALSDELLELAVERFFTLRTRDLRKIPATSELLANWTAPLWTFHRTPRTSQPKRTLAVGPARPLDQHFVHGRFRRRLRRKRRRPAKLGPVHPGHCRSLDRWSGR
ncbi:MAG: MoxR family ATPase [Planctomycetota bacterium]|nr:MoxR family ATPase [Planctomycetota bacterium]